MRNLIKALFAVALLAIVLPACGGGEDLQKTPGPGVLIATFQNSYSHDGVFSVRVLVNGDVAASEKFEAEAYDKFSLEPIDVVYGDKITIRVLDGVEEMAVRYWHEGAESPSADPLRVRYSNEERDESYASITVGQGHAGEDVAQLSERGSLAELF